MTNQLARQHSVRVGKLSATLKPKIHVVAVGYDVAKAILKRFASEGESNRNCVAVDDGFNRFRRLLQHDVAQCQREM
jgi:hypothetical protein